MAVWETQGWIAQTAHKKAGIYWRAVEAQHVVATMRLVDTLDEQALLEQILEASKPPIPSGVNKLHYLLTTPFRYTSSHPSRFRKPNAPGVWYGADTVQTACAEVGYWRWRFLMDSAGLRDGELITEHTLFQAKLNGNCIDLTAPPWSKLKSRWMNKSNYTACHALAEKARFNKVQWLAYTSVRHPGGNCAAVFDATALALYEPNRQETWVGKVTSESVMFTRATVGYSFNAKDWNVI